jgi:hypothetical protein
MQVVAVALLILILPHSLHAQRLEASWAFGASVATNPVVRDGANVGRLRPAFLAELGAHSVYQSGRRLGVIVQAVPFPRMRVKGINLAGDYVSRSAGGPILVLRMLTDVAPWSVKDGIAPSFGLGYSAFITPGGDCTSGTDSPLCITATRIHGAHGVTAHVGTTIGSSASRFSLHARFLVTRAPDMTTRDATFGVRWRASR